MESIHCVVYPGWLLVPSFKDFVYILHILDFFTFSLACITFHCLNVTTSSPLSLLLKHYCWRRVGANGI